MAPTKVDNPIMELKWWHKFKKRKTATIELPPIIVVKEK